MAQQSNLVAGLDQATEKWLTISEEIKTYEGLKKYCLNQEFNDNVLNTLNTLHHFDTVIYNVLVKKYRVNKDHEIKKTLDEIKEFESEYNPSKFAHFLNEECGARRHIEHDKKETIHDIGAESYDGQIELLETELYRYVKGITKVAERIKNHSHHLHLERYSGDSSY